MNAIAMFVLGIDTATPVASVGLVQGGKPIAVESRQAMYSHAETLLPLIARVLDRAGVSLPAVSGIGLSIGPGSFSGLRIALSTVKGFAYVLGHKVVGIPTLDALAHTVSAWEGLVCPLLDARRREVYAALFCRQTNGNVQKLTPDLVLTPDQLCQRIGAPCVFLGDGVETYGALIQQYYGSDARLLSFSAFPPRGDIVAQLAWKRLCQGEEDDFSTLEPFYVRLPEAQRNRSD